MATNPTTAEWKKAEGDLSYCGGSAYFLADDYLVTAKATQLDMKVVIVIYVNGWLKGNEFFWHGKESELAQMPEIARRFYRLRRKGRPAKEIKAWEKAFGKKSAKQDGIYDKFLSTEAYFLTPKSFVAHLKKNNNDIKILNCLEYQELFNLKHQQAMAKLLEEI